MHVEFSIVGNNGLRWDHGLCSYLSYSLWQYVGASRPGVVTFTVCLGHNEGSFCLEEGSADSSNVSRPVGGRKRRKEASSQANFARGNKKVWLALDALIPRKASETNKLGLQKNKEVRQVAYAGDWSGCSWNGQGLLAADAMKQHAKVSRARQLFKANDFLGTQETHSKEGKVNGVRVGPDARVWWSHGLGAEAGVGLWIKRNFIKDICGDTGEGEFIEAVKGRAAIWRGQGEQGKIQIGVVYLHTGNSGGPNERTPL